MNHKKLNIYFTAGYPNLNDTTTIIQALDNNGVDIIEIGMPYSDPLADGETIQKSSETALRNGMNLNLLFQQIKSVSPGIKAELVLMGYYNQLLQFGTENFLMRASDSGVQYLIIPDMPLEEYEEELLPLFENYGIGMCFLVTPRTKVDRIRKADKLSTGFLYVVSQSSITGNKGGISPDQVAYFRKIKDLNLTNICLVGFGIHDKATYESACQYLDGAIIGSQFIRVLGQSQKDLVKGINDYVQIIR